MDIHFIFLCLLSVLFYLFPQIVSIIGSSLSWLLCTSDIPMIMGFYFLALCTSWWNKMLQVHLTFSCSSFKIIPFQAPLLIYFLLNNNFRSQDLSLRNKVCSLLWGAIASSLLSWQTRNLYVWFNFFIKIFLEQFKVHNKIKRKAQRVFA